MMSQSVIGGAGGSILKPFEGMSMPGSFIQQQPLHPGIPANAVYATNPQIATSMMAYNEANSLEVKVAGRLKFFNEPKSYGFFVSDLDGGDVFFHYDDIKNTNLSKEFLRDAKNKFNVRFSFKIMAYYGKYNYSRKAVDIELLSIDPILS